MTASQEFSPVSMVIRRTPHRGREDEFEEALKDLVARLERFPGHTGTGVMRPSTGHREYTVLARFASADAAAAWEHSPQRQEWLRLMEPLNDAVSPLEQQTGLEFWFTPPDSPLARTAPRWKQIIMTICALYPVSLLINVLLAPHIAPLPLWVRVLLTSMLVVPIMLTWVLPFFNRQFARWLYSG